MTLDTGIDASNAEVAVSGQIFVADANAAIPSDLSFDPAMNGYDALGYLGPDGFTITPESSTTDLPGWQNGAILASIVSDAKLTANFVCVETRREVVEAFWGTTVGPDGSYTVNPGRTGGPKRWLFATIMNDGSIEIGSYLGEVTERGEAVYNRGDLRGYNFTVTFYPDAQYGGDTGKVWSSKLAGGSFSSSSSSS